MQPIFTLDARDNVMLEVMQDYLKLSNPVMRRGIQAMHQELVSTLDSKGIIYSKLGRALTPQADRHEAGFVFDTESIKQSFYGYEVAKEILPLLDKRSTHSVLCGDLIGDDQDLIYEILKESLLLSRSFTFVHGSSLYCVYINNLSDSALKRLHTELSKFNAYVGYVPASFNSRAKVYFSLTLVNRYIQIKHRVLMGHEDDRPNSENVNMAGYPFEEYGFEIFSIQSTLYDLFLSYKIERPVFSGYDKDTDMSLTAISNDVRSLGEFEVSIEESKHAYLHSEKSGKLKKAGIEKLSRTSLATLIKAKLKANYIYNLVYNEQHDVIKFNLMIEIPHKGKGYPTRITVALEYIPIKCVLRVITLY